MATEPETDGLERRANGSPSPRNGTTPCALYDMFDIGRHALSTASSPGRPFSIWPRGPRREPLMMSIAVERIAVGR